MEGTKSDKDNGAKSGKSMSDEEMMTSLNLQEALQTQTDHTFQLLATASDFRNSPLVGEEWSTATLDWRRYVYEQVPTAATHAQDKSVRSSSRRFDSQS